MFPCYTYRLIEIIVDQTNLGRIMAYGIIRVVKSQIGSGQAMEPSNILVLGLFHRTIVGRRAASKETASFRANFAHYF